MSHSTFFASGWENSLELRNHPINRGVHDEDDYQIWVGASLEVDRGAAPVIVGRYGYSDFGDLSNVQMSYLGDRRYNPSELLDDVVLAAEARLGRGKILVFGDTSGYQNIALPRSYAFVLRSVHHLGHPGGGLPGFRGQVAAGVLFALGLLALAATSLPGRGLLPFAAAAAGLLVTSVALAALTPPPPTPVLDWSRAHPVRADSSAASYPHKMAIIDRSHGGRYDLRAWYDFSVGGLMLNLFRDGFFPMLADRFPGRELDKADLLVLVAPPRSYSRAERQTIRRFLERGGRVLVCVGYEEFDGTRELLADYGLSVRDKPLAHFRTGETQNDLVFLEAWALDCPRGARVLVRQWKDPVVPSLAVGRGELVLIGDTHYLLNRNLEARETWFLGNIHFLSAIDSGKPVQPIEGKFGVPEPPPLADAPAFVAPPGVAPPGVIPAAATPAAARPAAATPAAKVPARSAPPAATPAPAGAVPRLPAAGPRRTP